MGINSLFRWSAASNACEVTDKVAVTECPWYARGSCASEPVTQREKVLRNLATMRLSFEDP